eukprot:12278148-Karenia_brevis.AAC.1
MWKGYRQFFARVEDVPFSSHALYTLPSCSCNFAGYGGDHVDSQQCAQFHRMPSFTTAASRRILGTMMGRYFDDDAILDMHYTLSLGT